MQKFVDTHVPAGTVTLVALRDKAVGFADIAAHQPMPPDALFWIVGD